MFRLTNGGGRSADVWRENDGGGLKRAQVDQTVQFAVGSSSCVVSVIFCLVSFHTNVQIVSCDSTSVSHNLIGRQLHLWRDRSEKLTSL